MTNPDKYVPHESSARETESIQHALTGVFAVAECIEKEEGTSKHATSWNAGRHQFVAVEQRRVFMKENLLGEIIQSVFQGNVLPLEIDEEDPRLGEAQPAKVRMTRIGIGDDRLCELRHYDYNHENGRLQVLNQAMTQEQFETLNDSPEVQESYTAALEQEFSWGMTASEEEWDDFKADLASFPAN